MDREGFKIGDKVKIKNPNDWNMNIRIGTIVGFDTYIRVTYEGGNVVWNRYPHLAREIEHVVKVGEQLLFNFMTP